VTTIYFEVDGEPVPADQCTWVLIAPCGCECAWSIARYCHSEDEAWHSFSRSKAARQRDVKLGFRLVIKRHKDIKISQDCPHTPTWGVPPRPQLDGHTWATKDRSRSVHLVPLVIEKNEYAYQQDSVAAVCRRASGYVWSARWYDLDGRTDCAACVAEAERLLAGSAVTP
jgi:hypothetical protein